MDIKIGISGKRIIPQEDSEAVYKNMETCIKHVLAKNNATGFIGVTALAIGADTVFAEVVTKVFKMPLQIVLPFPYEEYKKDFSENDLNIFNYYLNIYSNTHVVTDNIYQDESIRKEAYFSVGKYLVDTCDEMIFVWDEEKPAGKGGTSDIISYYYEKKDTSPPEIILINKNSKNSIWTNIQDEYIRINNIALRQRDNYKTVWRLSLLLGWFAVICFGVGTAFETIIKNNIRFFLVCMEFILVLSVFLIIVVAKKKDFHGQYLRERLKAETLRLIKYYFHAGILIKLPDITSESDPELKNLIQKVNSEIQQSKYISKWYANYSIKLLIHEQLNYHQFKVGQSGEKFRRLEKINLGIALCFLINLVVHLVISIQHFFHNSPSENIIDQTIVFLNILLPATYAVIESILYFQDWPKILKHSIATSNNLNKALKLLPENIDQKNDFDCFSQQTMVLNMVSSIMLSDNRSWHFIFEDKDNYHWVI